MTLRKQRLWIAVIFAVLTGVFITYGNRINSSTRVLSSPIRLTPDFRSEIAFTVPRKADFRVYVYCLSSADDTRIRSLLEGEDLVNIAVFANGTAIPLYFFNETKAKVAAIGSPTLPRLVVSRPGEAGQELANFSGQPGVRYLLRCSVKRPLADLDQLKPMLTVELDPMVLKGDFMLVGLLYSLSIATTVVALVALAFYFAGREASS